MEIARDISEMALLATLFEYSPPLRLLRVQTEFCVSLVRLHVATESQTHPYQQESGAAVSPVIRNQ